MEKKILLFGFTDFAGRMQGNALASLLAAKGIPVINIGPENDNTVLGYLAAGTTAQREDRRCAPGTKAEAAAEQGRMLKGRMLVFCGIDPEEELDEILALCRSCGIGKEDLKAFLTPANITWTALELNDELRKEHKALNP